MKKRFTLLSILTVASTFSFAQTIPSFKTAEKKASKIAINDPKNVINGTSIAKAGGDPIWSDDFSTPGTWTMGNLTPGVQGAFVVGAYPSDMTDYIGAMTNGTAPVASFNGIQYLLTGPVGIQNAWLQSPAITFPAGAISISFNQRYRRFNHDAVYVEVSEDDGATWSTYQVNTDAIGNGPVLQNTKVVDVPTTASTQGRIRFRWESLTADNDYGSGYGWAIDNVAITEGYANNVQLFQTFSSTGVQKLSYTKIPTVQAAATDVITFGAIAKNTGSASQDVILTVTNPAGAFSEASAPVTIASFEKDSLEVVTADGFTIPVTVGTSNFTYTLTSNNTLDVTGDDSGVVPFEVTNKIMAADSYDGTTASMGGSFNGWQNGTGNPEIGTVFEIFADQTLHAIQVGIGSVAATDQAPYIGRSLVAKIYEVPASGDPEIVDATEEHYMATGEFGGLLKLYFSIPVDLQAGKTYLITASTILDEEIPIAFAGYLASGNVLGKDGETFIGLAADEILGNVVQCPVVRLDFTDYTGLEELASDFSVNAYPNPFNASTEIAFELKNESAVSVKVTDVTGREVLNLGSKNYTAGAHTVAINGADLNAGVYNYTLTIGNNVITKRIVKK